MERDQDTAPAATRETISSALPRSGERLAYLDWLRFLVVLSLAPFHGALSYSGIGTVWVYDNPVRDAIRAGQLRFGEFGPVALQYFTVFMDNWFMHLLFFVSGIGAAVSLRKRSARAFVAERADRLLKPLLLMTLIAIPVQAWLRSLDFETFSGGFFEFYPHFFDGIYSGPGRPGNFEYGHLWFLLYLFAFCVIALPLFGRWKRIGSPTGRIEGDVHAGWVLAPALWIGLLEEFFRPGWPGFQNFVNDWANFTVYLSIFVFGYLAGGDPRLPDAIERHRWAALALGVIAFFARLACYRVLPVGSGYDAFNMLAQFLRGIAAWGLIIAATGFGRRHLNLTGRGWGIARDLSFPLYLLHAVPLTAATYLLLGAPLGIWSRWAISVVASWTTVAICTFVFRYIPPLQSFFTIRPPHRAQGA
ncbi:MAG TPA: acyltransferase [Burkholderiaceae bacterium]|nr:acyltransferase [Burkholderiaceae bacterium]